MRALHESVERSTRALSDGTHCGYKSFLASWSQGADDVMPDVRTQRRALNRGCAYPAAKRGRVIFP
jgi:hypothetical protein